MDGRKKRSVATRARILEGARRVFLERGYAGGSLKQVAEEAGVTQSLIHHHFRTKEHLWQGVQEAGFQGVLKDLRPILSEAARSPEFLEVLFEAYFRYLEEHPEYVRLLGWTYAEPEQTRALQPGQARQATALVESLQGEGRVTADLEAWSILPILWSMAEGWHMGRLDYARRLGLESEAMSSATYLRAVRQLLRSGLIGGGPSAAQS